MTSDTAIISDTNRLDGRTALVTGAGGLLGPQHGAALALAGARVVATDVDLPRAELAAAAIRREAPGAEVLARALDVTDEAGIRALAEALDAEGVPVNILVNNAAIDPKVTASPGLLHASRFEAFSRAQWEIEIAVGLTGAMLCAQAFGMRMARRGDGVVLNIASDLAVIAPDQRLYRKADARSEDEQPVKPVTYSVIKHGLVGLTKYLATYWANAGVRVNALSPGGVFNGQDPAFVGRLAERIPMGRMAQVEEYRGAVVFLCSPASSYMTGQNVVMDGGRSVW